MLKSPLSTAFLLAFSATSLVAATASAQGFQGSVTVSGSANVGQPAPPPPPPPAAPAPAPAPTGNANCPPGSWFCGDTHTQAQVAPGQPVEPVQQLPPPNAREPQQPPVIIYQPSPPPVYQPYRPAPPPYYVAPPPPPRWVQPRSEFGLNLRFEGASLGGQSSMGGGGLGLRYKPSPYFGLEAGLDFFGGHDYNGNDRTETAFRLDGLFFLNPRNRAQVYLLAGLGWSSASVDTYDATNGFENPTYHYFGGELGIGIEGRLSRHFALNFDVRGFVRGRTDDAAGTSPEFTNSNGQSTNTSGGALATFGMTFYF